MEKENILEIEITKINEIYSLAKVTKMNRKVIEEKKKYYFGYANSSSLETNSILYEAPSFKTYISNTIPCFDLHLNSENDCFTIKNILVESLELFLQEFNEKYGIPKRWRAEEGGIYWFIDSDFTGKVRDLWDQRSTDENVRYNLGNYFKTKVEAEKVKKELDKFWDKVRAGEIGE